MSAYAWVAIYSVAVLLFSLAGGSVPLLKKVSHDRLKRREVAVDIRDHRHAHATRHDAQLLPAKWAGAVRLSSRSACGPSKLGKRSICQPASAARSSRFGCARC